MVNLVAFIYKCELALVICFFQKNYSPISTGNYN